MASVHAFDELIRCSTISGSAMPIRTPEMSYQSRYGFTLSEACLSSMLG
jgi:hypothetical protein